MNLRSPVYKYGLCAVSGMAASLSLPPVGLVPALLFFCPVVYFSAVAPKTKEAVFYLGFAAWGWLFASLYWIGSSLFVAGGFQLILLPFVCLVFPFCLALFWATGAGLAHRLLSSPEARLIGFIIALGGADYLRSVLLTGFPWNVSAHAFLGWLPLALTASFVGQTGVNFLVMSIVVAPVFAFRRQFGLVVASLIPLLVCTALSGAKIITMPPVQNLNENAPVIRLVQPNISQKDKWDRDKRGIHLTQIITLSKHHPRPASLTILPEAAIASIWPHERQLVQNMAKLTTTRPSGIVATGMLRRDDDGRLLNSVMFFNGTGELLHLYDKQHLVPFGEYVPARGLPFVDVIAGKIDLSSGGPARLADLPGLGKIRALICYEIIFPDFIAQDSQRPDMLLTVSNDAWFGQTAGPHQHFAQARMRAIEEGLPVIRVANTGVSGAIDSYGRVVAHSQLGRAEAIDVPILLPLESTVYAQMRLFAPWIVLASYLLLCFWLEIYAKRRNNKI